MPCLVRLHRKRINISTVLAGQRLGIKEVDEGIWLASFMGRFLAKAAEGARAHETLLSAKKTVRSGHEKPSGKVRAMSALPSTSGSRTPALSSPPGSGSRVSRF